MSEHWMPPKEELQTFGEQMLRAGWVTSFRIDETHMQMNFIPSEKGKKKLKQLWNVIGDLDEDRLSAVGILTLLDIMYRAADANGWHQSK